MTIWLEHGDMREVMRRLLDEKIAVDAIVTDPPYHLTTGKKGGSGEASLNLNSPAGRSIISTGFMGRQWDGGDIAFQADTWRLCYEILPPGGHLVAFGGTRTFHRLVCAIEDAGFEIRDTLSWNFGTGFPKSHNVSKTLDAEKKRCTCGVPLPSVQATLDTQNPLPSRSQQNMRADVRGSGNIKGEEKPAPGDTEYTMQGVRQDGPSRAIAYTPKQGDVLQLHVSSQNDGRSTETFRSERERQKAAGSWVSRQSEPGLERRRDISKETRELREREVRQVSARPASDGTNRWLCDGASVDNGAMGGPPANENRNGSSSRSQPTQQPTKQSGTVAGQPQPQARGAWPLCGRCGKPIIPDGLGTALKPACELICLARKPLIGTVAANVQAHGTGALNIDGCRIEAEITTGWGGAAAGGQTWNADNMGLGKDGEPRPVQGRWPANVCHDGSDEVVEMFPDAGGASAARFFYSAKASSKERRDSKHPTVKPVKLMQWLVRLITPPGGMVLDPFAGTGTTGEACKLEGFDCTLIEREAEYAADIRKRIPDIQVET